MRLKGSTLIETLVAMILLIMFVSMSAISFNSILSTNNSAAELNALMLLSDVAAELKKNPIYIDEETSYGETRIKKSFINYKSSPNLIILELRAYSENDRLLAHRKEIVIRRN